VNVESPSTARRSRGARTTFRRISARHLEPGFMWLMVLGIAALCQPWHEALHAHGITITLVGLIGFSAVSKIKPPPEDR